MWTQSFRKKTWRKITTRQSVSRWDDIKRVFKSLDRINVAQNRNRWWTSVNTAMNVESFSSSLATVSVSRRTRLRGFLSRWRKVCTRMFRQGNVTASSDNPQHRYRRSRTYLSVKGLNRHEITQWHKRAPMTQIFSIPVHLESGAIQLFAIQPDEMNTNLGPTQNPGQELMKPYVPSKHSSVATIPYWCQHSSSSIVAISFANFCLLPIPQWRHAVE